VEVEGRKRELMTKFQIEVDEEVYKELKAIDDRWFNGSLNASVKLVLNIYKITLTELVERLRSLKGG
jgi:hypothetical protein